MALSLTRRVAAMLCLAILTIAPRGWAAEGDPNDLLRQARDDRREGRLDQAADRLRQILGTVPAEPQTVTVRAAAHAELAEVHRARNDLAGAVSEFERSLEVLPAQPVIEYQAGLLQMRLGNHARAAGHLDRAVDLGFRNTAALLNLVNAQFASRQSTAALARSREILAMNLPSAAIPRQLGELLFQYLFYRDALPAFELALAKDRSSYDTRFYLGLTNYLLNRHEEAIQMLTPLSVETGALEVWNLLACAHAQLDHFERAETILRAAIDKDASSPHAYLNLALIRLEQGRQPEAEELLRKASAFESPKVFYSVRRNSCPSLAKAVQGGAGTFEPDPDKAALYFHLAETFQQRYHHATAAALLGIARQYEGDTARLLYALGFSCLNIDAQSSAPITLLQKAVDVDPRDVEANFLLGRAYAKQRRFEEAAGSFRKALAIEARALYYTELGQALASQESADGRAHLDEALEALRKAVEVDPSAALAHYELGKALVRLSRWEEALAHLTKAVEAEPEFYEAHYQLGRVHTQLREPDKARESFAQFERTKQTASQRSTITEGFVSERR